VPTRFDDLLRRHMDRTAGLHPPGLRVWDAHTHLGVDEDGFTLTVEELLETMQAQGVERAFSFPLNDPDRHPGYRVPNDRVLHWAAESGGAIVPFCRLDLTEDPIAEAERCLDAGARGIKLHPRAQAFDFGEAALNPVFQLAAERRVPILIHGGRGLPPIADGLRALVDRYPEAALIIAHAGIADLAELARAMAGRKRVFFDTSTWSPVDLLDFYRQVPPEQVVYASDYPYGQQPSSLLMALKTARYSGYDDDQLRAMLGGTANALADGDELPEPTTPVGSGVYTQSMQFTRIHQYLSMATPLLWTRQSDTIGVLGLAINTCGERNGHVEQVDRIRELLETASDLWLAIPAVEDKVEQLQLLRLTHRLIHIADVEAVTAA
jgi:predicted TIM-barrel fold metal-dependent hydrolase